MTESQDLKVQDAIDLLQLFLTELCQSKDEDRFVRQLAMSTTRWASVEELLRDSDRASLHEIAFKSPRGGFSSGNLKAHYVLDEDFINDGTALILFSLVGSDWSFVVRVINQNSFTPESAWVEG